MIRINYRKLTVWLGSLVAAAYVSVAPAIFDYEAGAPDDYPSCVFSAVDVAVDAAAVAAIEQACRQQFPSATVGGWLAWSNIGHCYDQQEPKAGNRVAAVALFNACSEYFL